MTNKSKTIFVKKYKINSAGHKQDDLACIQNAIDVASPGDTVFFPNGIYNIHGAITIEKPGITLQGESMEGVVIKEGDAAGNGCILSVTARSNITVENITFDGDDRSYAINGLHFSGCNQVKVCNCTVININTEAKGYCVNTGILFTDNKNSEISRCTVSRCGDKGLLGVCISLACCTNCNVLDNRVSYGGYDGIGVNSSTYIVIRGNHISHSLGVSASIECYNNVNYTIIEDNICDHFLSVAANSNNAVRRNTVGSVDTTYDCWCGLEMISSDSVFTDNYVSQGHRVGMSISGGESYLYIAGNVFDSMGTSSYKAGGIIWGEEGQAGSRGFYLYDNTFRNTDGGPGFSVDMCQDLTFENCTFEGNTTGFEFKKKWHKDDTVDGLYFRNCKIINNSDKAYSEEDAVGRLEFADMHVSGNGSNTLPSERGFGKPLPVASFTGPASVMTGEPVMFKNTSYTPEGGIAHYLWDFGDGLPSTYVNGYHAYNQPGTYTVTLIIWNTAGRAARASAAITVNAL